MDDSVVIGIYRHGITTDNERKAFSGWTNSVLSEQGKKELSAIKSHLPAYEKVIASDLSRCQDTAAILFSNKDIDLWPEFREMNFGLWEGKVHDELKHMKEYAAWVNDPFTSPLPNGEHFSEFHERINRAWQKWLDYMERHGIKKGAIVTHGGVIRHLLTQFAPEQKSFWEWPSKNGQGYELSGSLEKLRRGERCTSLQAVPSMGKNSG
ncbi:alpha-ribazole phosphatase [Bacillus ectoiniformans]|uniref:histidine phosphatase family protein n=1 Tax=Bacillus ectoiniformans TaxID=1494429 RepID=UPI0019593E48|nr:histidine phosphatase family protein [Bacillus ectoiniformans]MBM7649549.1 alpha-ribazole phosphatase [Bacillus ectoiniformans]